MSKDKNKLLFIANPISGAKGKVPLESLLPQYLDLSRFDYEIYYTQARGDAVQKARESVSQVDGIVAVGGDGTINEVAQGLVHTQTPMGIIPNGSGNGFAKHLAISLNPKEAIERINTFQIRDIDTGLFNDNLFLCVAGLGFDAEVAHAFDQSPTRGFHTYIWLTVKSYLGFRPHNFTIKVDNQELQRRAFLITAANASQFGNDAYIAPEAQIDDGLLDLVILKPFHWWHGPMIAAQMFTKKLNRSDFYQCIRAKEIVINSAQTTAQIDGEPISAAPDNVIKVQPRSLKMIA